MGRESGARFFYQSQTEVKQNQSKTRTAFDTQLKTVEPRFNEVPRDWGNWFVISRFFSIHYTINGAENYRSLYRGLHCIEIR